jgi:hypothetical protein
MKSDNIKFILNLMKNINYEQELNIPLLNEINFIDKRNTYIKNVSEIKEENYDSKISNYYNDNITNIINKDLQIFNFINTKFYGENLKSNFISSRIIRNIINNLFIKTEFNLNNRKITIFSKNNLDHKLINKIDSILNFFDYLTKKNNYYKIDIYLSDQKKQINFNNDFLGPDNINSGLTLPRHYIVLFRKEELIKVLIHELIHYLDLDMRNNQNELLFLYKDINLKADIINPNEAYTEILAIVFLNIWEYYYRNFKINNFIKYKLNIELYWSFIQITKILKFFKYKSFDDLFTKKSLFHQKTNVLSYFFLKTVLLLNLNLIFNDLTLDNIYFNNDRLEIIKQNCKLEQLKGYIDKVYSDYESNEFDKSSLKMTFYG